VRHVLISYVLLHFGSKTGLRFRALEFLPKL
jgi:hypothetical protein